jgi:hypothetical protein
MAIFIIKKGIIADFIEFGAIDLKHFRNEKYIYNGWILN